ncbi:MAG: hypothetical protein ACK55Z_34525, partial [bacterium]
MSSQVGPTAPGARLFLLCPSRSPPALPGGPLRDDGSSWLCTPAMRQGAPVRVPQEGAVQESPEQAQRDFVRAE